MSALTRAYSVLQIKSVDDDQRIIEGVASTPGTDRTGDVVESKGAKFTLPIPFLWQHEGRDAAIGHVISAKPSKDGIPVRIKIESDNVPGPLKDRLDYAWRAIKKGLVRGLSIGFHALDMEPIKDSFGTRFKEWEWLELSAVTIPANMDATIQTIKSCFDTPPAVSGTGVRVVRALTSPHAAGTRSTTTMKTIQEQISGFEATRQAKSAEMTAIMTAAGEKGETLDAEQSEKYDTLKTEVKSIDEHLVRLRDLETVTKATAVPVVGSDPQKASENRGGNPVIQVRDNLPPGIGFARAVMCQVAARLDGRDVLSVAKSRYPDHVALHNYLITKGAVPAGTTTQAVWASPLVYATNLTSEFIEFMRPQTVIGKFGTGNVPSLTRVPFNIRVPSQTSGGDGYWVGEGAPKPLTSFAFSSVTLAYMKVAAIAVITKELARFSTPSAETLVRDQLARAITERMDVDFIDPAHAVSASISPASITNGLTALTSAGTAIANVHTDIVALLAPFLNAHYNPASLVLIMPNTLALAVSLMRNSLGQKEFNDLTSQGGTIEGIPVITSQYAANVSGGGNLVIAVSAKDILLADDGNVTVDASEEASLQMLDNPTNNSATATATTMVSMFQTNSIALRAEREITWTKARTDAVVYMDDVNWNAVGSPS